MQGFYVVGLFLLETLFSVIIFVILLRLYLQFFRASIYNQFCGMLAKITNPVILPLRKILPKLSAIDLATLLLFFIVDFIKFTIYGFIYLGDFLPIDSMLLFLIADFLIQSANLFFIVILLSVILSWVRPGARDDLTEMLYTLSEPFLALARKIIPPFSGIDLSPILVLFVLKAMTLFVSAYLPAAFF
jgi:YggT family protein